MEKSSAHISSLRRVLLSERNRDGYRTKNQFERILLLVILRPLFTFLQSSRTIFKQEGRKYSKDSGFFLKFYDSAEIAKYENKVMKTITAQQTTMFRVPKVQRIARDTANNYIVAFMERVEGRPLEFFIHTYLLGEQVGAIKMFYELGKAIHELHSINSDVTYASSLPRSKKDLLNEITNKVNSLDQPEFADLRARFENYTKAKRDIDENLMESVNLYGEAYFSHIMFSKGKFVFFDMERANRGPLYSDLATLTVSIYTSVFIPTRAVSKLEALRNALLYGYFGSKAPLESFRVTELYFLLREIVNLYSYPGYAEETFMRRLSRALKLRRCRWIANYLLTS